VCCVGKVPEPDDNNNKEGFRGFQMKKRPGSPLFHRGDHHPIRRNYKNENDNHNKIQDMSLRKKKQIQSVIRNVECHEQMSAVREEYYYQRNILQNETHTSSLYDLLIQLPCTNNIITLLQPYSEKHINFLFSDEGMSRSGPIVYRQWTKYDSYSSKYDYISLSILLQPIYQLSVIVSYRRYYEWFISAKQEQERYKKYRFHWNVWPLLPNSTIANFSANEQEEASTIAALENNDNEQEEDANENDDTVSTDPNDTTTTTTNTRKNEIFLSRRSGGYFENVLPGLMMENSLFPNYYQNVIPGVLKHHNNPFQLVNENETAIYNFEQRRSVALSKSIYWANTIGIPYHYTYTMMNDLYQQQQLMLSKYNDHHDQNDTNNNPLNVIIFNLHTLSSTNQYTKPLVRTTFFCDALPNAQNLCQHSKELDIKGTKEKHSNPSIDYSIYDQLMSIAYLYGYLSSSMIQRGRHSVVSEAEKYHKQLLLGKEQSQKSSYEIIYTCPHPNDSESSSTLYEHQEHLYRFLNQSLDFEETILPTFYRDPAGKERHVKDYWDHVYHTKKFCSVNINDTLAQSHWTDFLSNT
jgi:hypothetical protein